MGLPVQYDITIPLNRRVIFHPFGYSNGFGGASLSGEKYHHQPPYFTHGPFHVVPRPFPDEIVTPKRRSRVNSQIRSKNRRANGIKTTRACLMILFTTVLRLIYYIYFFTVRPETFFRIYRPNPKRALHNINIQHRQNFTLRKRWHSHNNNTVSRYFCKTVFRSLFCTFASLIHDIRSNVSRGRKFALARYRQRPGLLLYFYFQTSVVRGRNEFKHRNSSYLIIAAVFFLRL